MSVFAISACLQDFLSKYNHKILIRLKSISTPCYNILKMATVIENQCISYNELEILKFLMKFVYRFKRQFWEYKNFVQKETAQTAIVNYRRFMEHVPILVAMPFWCLPDQGMLKVVSLAPKPQWVTKTKMRKRQRDGERWTQRKPWRNSPAFQHEPGG